MVGGVTGFDHERTEDVGTDDSDADRQDGHPDSCRRERREGDPGRDPAADHVREWFMPGRPVIGSVVPPG